ncbi:MAG: NADH-quinone oxidoreductase subunit N [Polyangiales bacterium]
MTDHVFDNAHSLGDMLPELVLIAAIMAVIVWDLVVKGRGKIEGIVAISLVALGYAGFVGGFVHQRSGYEYFGGLVRLDALAYVSRAFFAFVTGLAMILSVPRKESRQTFGKGRGDGQFFMLLLAISLGMNLMGMSNNLLMIYLSLEMVSVISFVMAGFKLDDRKSWEGALKYVIFGGVSSGIMLYGMSWIFGLTQSLHLPTIAVRIAELSAQQGHVPDAVIIGVVCMMAGFGYKISAAPFHMWAPDVYEGAPTQVTMFLSVGPKAAGFIVMIRFFDTALWAGNGVGTETWKMIAGVIAIATMTIGNLSALGQMNIKRMLAYSSIAHAGYMMLAFAVFSVDGIFAVLFYILVYCAMNFGAFLVQLAVAEQTGDETIGGFRGLGVRSPAMAVAMTMFLFSLAGIPPLAGFVGKFYIFMALLKMGGTWYWTLALAGITNSVISVFYYARIARAMWLEKPTETREVNVRSLYGATAFALAIPTLVLGIWWTPLYNWVSQSLMGMR